MDLLVGPSSNGLDPEALPSPSVRVAAVVVRDRLRVVLQGDVDIAAGPALAGLADLVAASGLPVEVDASRVTFLDCSGLAAVLALGAGAPGLSLHAASPAVALLLRLTGALDEALAIDLDGLVVTPLTGG